jgi:hypothetical protein
MFVVVLESRLVKYRKTFSILKKAIVGNLRSSLSNNTLSPRLTMKETSRKNARKKTKQMP